MVNGFKISTLIATATIVGVCTSANVQHYAKHDVGLFKALKSAGKLNDPSYPPCKVGNFSQDLDHGNVNDDTTSWNQQYQSATQFWTAGKPVFLLLGGEGPASCLWLEHNTNVMINAQKFGAAVYQLEHRFYGISQPFGLDSADALSTQNLEYLTSQQAIADAANFVTKHVKSVHGDVPVISFGGSYSGALSAWLRLKYPDVIHAAVSTSSPILAEEDYVEYQQIINRSLTLVPVDASLGPKCIAGITAATKLIEPMTTSSDGLQQLSKMFNTCKPIEQGAVAIANFMSNLAGNYDGVVQYSRDNRAWEHPGSPAPPSITDVCNPFASSDDSLTQYLKSQDIMSNFTGECMDVDYEAFVTGMKATNVDQPFGYGARQWTWQTCVEFGYFQSSDSMGQPFGSLFPLSFSTQQCYDIYGVEPMDVATAINHTNVHYGGKNYGGERVVFVNGQVDPWHPLSLLPWDLPSNAPSRDISTVLMNDTAHCAIMYPPSDVDVADLTAARSSVQAKLGEWLNPSK